MAQTFPSARARAVAIAPGNPSSSSDFRSCPFPHGVQIDEARADSRLRQIAARLVKGGGIESKRHNDHAETGHRPREYPVRQGSDGKTAATESRAPVLPARPGGSPSQTDVTLSEMPESMLV